MYNCLCSVIVLYGMMMKGREKVKSTTVGQAAACMPVTQQARVRFPVGTSSLGEVFFRVFPHLYDKCRETLGPQGP